MGRYIDINDSYANPEHYTAGQWTDETSSCTALDAILDTIGGFNIYREVPGQYLQPRLGQPTSTPRVDRVLIPRTKLLDSGWPYGPIAIECKRSHVNIGPVTAQLLDYSRAAWQIRPGFWIVTQWTFLWPAPDIHGPMLSVYAQNRLGLARPGTYNKLLILSSGQNLATFNTDGTIRVGAGLNGAGRNGWKAGSR